jgi:hypothetical protein
MGGIEMGMLEKWLPFLHKPPCAPCRDKIEEIQSEQREQRERIAKMEAELTATMNGEETWFLAPRKKEDSQHG